MHTAGTALIAAAVFCGALFVYPYLIYPLLLKAIPEMPVRRRAASEQITGGDWAILFSAFNEERTAAEKVANLERLLARYPDLQILIYDDASTDGTCDIFSRLGREVVMRGETRAGKAAGMARLVASCDRRLLLFTDANVILDEKIITKATPYFEDESVGGICGHLEYLSSEQTATQVAGGAYWRLEEAIKRRESASGNVMGGDGSIFAVRRELYPDVPLTAQDDFTVTMSVVYAGRRLVVADDVIAWERLVATSSDEYRRKVRISARAVHTHLTMRQRLREMRWLDKWKYVSHKMLRWGGAFFLAASLALGVVGFSLIDAGFGALAFGVVLACAVAIACVPQMRALREVFLAIAATGHGVILALRGVTFPTWTPPASR